MRTLRGALFPRFHEDVLGNKDFSLTINDETFSCFFILCIENEIGLPSLLIQYSLIFFIVRRSYIVEFRIDLGEIRDAIEEENKQK